MTAEFKRGDRFVYRHIAGEHLLVALHQDRVAPLFTFSPTGASLWRELGEWSSVERLTEHLVNRYDVSREDAARDVMAFLEQLSSLNALETREVTP
ncbi:MAG TPA: PqqD family protein [Gemmatimonadaceae bacterium]|nr:PqqD family protein [Gemmatimonadaceae bacterium]